MNRNNLFPCAVDMHSHILPGIDDGSADLAQSVRMAKIAVREGIRSVMATPHLILDGMQDALIEQASRGIAILRSALREEGIRLELQLGCELYLTSSVFGEEDISRYTISRSRVLLFEPGEGCGPELLGDAVSWMLDEKVIPLLAHPEIIPWLESEAVLLKMLCAKGMWLQFNSPSITGHNGRAARRRVKALCKSGMNYVLGSDAHNDGARPPHMREALKRLKGWTGAKSAVSAASFSARRLMES